MVIGKKFAWAHLPKTGGIATTELFRLFPDLIVSGDFEESNDRHALFTDREAEIKGKMLALNFRRLPFWVLSRAQHAASEGIWPDYDPIPMESPGELSKSSFPDSRLALYTGEGRLSIHRWIRMERLAEDFTAFISEFTHVGQDKRAQIFGLEPMNTRDYDRDVTHWFSEDQLRAMYEHNPLWAQIEQQLYGDLLGASDDTPPQPQSPEPLMPRQRL